MKKIYLSEVIKYLPLLISILSIVIAFLAYMQSVKASNPKIEVSFPNQRSMEIREYDICYLPNEAKYSVSRDDTYFFVISNRGGLDVTLFSVDYLEKKDLGRGTEITDLKGFEKYRLYEESDDELFFPLNIAAGTGTKIYLDGISEHYYTDKKEEISKTYLDQTRPKILTWTFVFSDGSWIVKEVTEIHIIRPPNVEDIENCLIE